jgi:predicted metalloprotease with PDZ domain
LRGIWPAAALVAALGACAPNLALHRDAGTAIRYVLEPIPATADAEGSTRVRMVIQPTPGTASVRLQMPVWTPGEYRIQRHARYVRNLRVQGSSATVSRPDANTWEVPTAGTAPIQIEYQVLNAPPGVFTENVHVRSRRAFYNGPATFLYVAGRTQEPVTLEVRTPRGWAGPETPLERLPDSAGTLSTGLFRASGYDELADSPIHVGDAVRRSFEMEGREHRAVFIGNTSGLTDDVYLDTMRRIVGAGSEYMGGLPYPRYVLFLDLGGRGGGLEHANAARIAWIPWASTAMFGRFLAHEYFHLWNVKRIRPACLGPFDYINPPKTRNLWFCEGVTEYVAGLLAHRAGILDQTTYLDDLARSIGDLAANPARRRVTAETASLRIWEEGESRGYGGLSVYLKGELIGLCLDLELLRVTDGRFGMRELMRDLMERHAPPSAGYGEDGIREAVIRAGGASMGAFYDRLCRSTEEMPIEACLASVGMSLTWSGGRAAITPNNAARPDELRRRRLWLTGR